MQQSGQYNTDSFLEAQFCLELYDTDKEILLKQNLECLFPRQLQNIFGM